MKANGDQLALEAFWAINHSGGFTPEYARDSEASASVRPFLDHPTAGGQSPHERQPACSINSLGRLGRNVEVRLSRRPCKRWPAKDSFPILAQLIRREEDVNDKHIPLLLWWALEDKSTSDLTELVKLLRDQELWKTPMMQQHLLPRIAQRYGAEPIGPNLAMAGALFSLAPTAADKDRLVNGLEAGLKGGSAEEPPLILRKEVKPLWTTRPHSPALISLATRWA